MKNFIHFLCSTERLAKGIWLFLPMGINIVVNFVAFIHIVRSLQAMNKILRVRGLGTDSKYAQKERSRYVKKYLSTFSFIFVIFKLKCLLYKVLIRIKILNDRALPYLKMFLGTGVLWVLEIVGDLFLGSNSSYESEM